MTQDRPLALGEADAGAGRAVSLRGITAGYTKGAVLRGLDFHARGGETAVIVGAASVGKSVLLDVIRAVLDPVEGDVSVLGAEPIRLSGRRRAKLKRQIGFVGQQPRLMEHLTAFENVALPLRLAGAKSTDFAADVEELLRFLGMPEDEKRAVETLSGSARRRVAVARAVVSQPRLLLADEPTAGLAPEMASRVLRLLVSMRRAGSAVIVATQDEGVAAQLAGPRWRLAEGRTVLDAPALESAN
ncbi:MAG: ATP-binding cassette domain-containing protein, partial [Hyphomonadaceae bacterium]